MVNSDSQLRFELVTKRIRAQIENLKYDRDVIRQQQESFPYGILNRRTLIKKLKEIENKIIQLEAKLQEYEHNSINMDTSDSAIKILFLAADPTNASRLRLGEELREIQEKLQLARMRERFQLHERMSVRPADISQSILDTQPQIIHFSGHGDDTGALCFENQIGQVHTVQPESLAALFQHFSKNIKCVLLNACYSEIQAKAISEHIKFVIGMNAAIGDRAAIAFTIGFYQALGAGQSIEESYKLGVIQIQLQGIPEHLTPVLIKKE